jgi:hypothetical protein
MNPFKKTWKLFHLLGNLGWKNTSFNVQALWMNEWISWTSLNCHSQSIVSYVPSGNWFDWRPKIYMFVKNIYITCKWNENEFICSSFECLLNLQRTNELFINIHFSLMGNKFCLLHPKLLILYDKATVSVCMGGHCSLPVECFGGWGKGEPGEARGGRGKDQWVHYAPGSH